MANELNIQLDPFSNTGLILIARVYAKDGTEQTGSPVVCSEVASALYTGDFALASISDDAYSVRFETNTPDELYGTGKLFVRNSEEVTQEGFFDSSLDEVITDTASRDASKADVTGLSTFDPSTDPVANVTLVGTCTTNTDMRGTDGANTTTPPTAAEIDAELTGTHGAGSWESGSGGDDASTIYTYFTDGIREDAFKANVSGLSTFDPSSDTVANVTTVQTTVSNTDMRGTDSVPTTPLLDNDARLNNLDTTISSRSDFDSSIDEVITDSASRDASKANVSLLGTHADLVVINTGVKKASQLKPHTENLP